LSKLRNFGGRGVEYPKTLIGTPLPWASLAWNPIWQIIEDNGVMLEFKTVNSGGLCVSASCDIVRMLRQSCVRYIVYFRVDRNTFRWMLKTETVRFSETSEQLRYTKRCKKPKGYHGWITRVETWKPAFYSALWHRSYSTSLTAENLFFSYCVAVIFLVLVKCKLNMFCLFGKPSFYPIRWRIFWRNEKRVLHLKLRISIFISFSDKTVHIWWYM
jgi:hypothetical protein